MSKDTINDQMEGQTCVETEWGRRYMDGGGGGREERFVFSTLEKRNVFSALTVRPWII